MLKAINRAVTARSIFIKAVFIYSLLLGIEAQATCQRISTTTTVTTDPYYVNPAYGKTGIWYGAVEANRGFLNLPIINVSDTIYQPNGTLLGSSIVPFITYGQTGGYDPEQVLYRCAPEDQNLLYEIYSVNADDPFSGMYEDGLVDGIEKGYATAVQNVVLRIKNNLTGRYFSRLWQYRALTNLDRDGQGRILVKAKNFTDITLELFQIRTVRGYDGTSTQADPYMSAYIYNQPAAYIAFGGPGILHPTEGVDHITHFPGFYHEWPGNISLYQQLIVRRTPARCFITSVTPYVPFPTMSVMELEQGKTSVANIQLQYRCKGNMTSGTKLGNFAIGFKIAATNFTKAKSLGLTNIAAVSHLLSNNYGSAGFAKGVGVKLERPDGLTQPFVLKDYPTVGSGTLYNPEQDGWRRFIGNAIDYDPVEQTTNFNDNYQAIFTKLPGQAVTAGRYYAQTQVLIRVQ